MPNETNQGHRIRIGKQNEDTKFVSCLKNRVRV